ncbi:hypothetical protein Bca101_027326 [Brassica carinata]
MGDQNIRMMLPMSVQCNRCGNYIYMGLIAFLLYLLFTRFLVFFRRADISWVQIFIFHFRCTRCYAELTMKTDPIISGYIAESGANHDEPWA